MSGASPAATRAPLIVVAGNPNTGKTTIFNRLTGSRAKVGNYAGVTVEQLEGELRLPNGSRARVLDVPGTYSLSARSEEERKSLTQRLSNAQEAAEAARSGMRSGIPMVAVLPFAAVGAGDDSRFFAAGVHDDLLTKLAQLRQTTEKTL